MNAPPPLSLLLVDDEEGIRTVLSLLLADMGCAVRTAASGAEALAMVRATPPAVLLTDVRMPGMDGIDLLRAVKAEFPGVEVLVLTGHGDMELAVSSLRHGAGDFLTKPVSPEALEVALDRARQRMALREALRRHTEELEQLVAQRTRELLHAERLAAVGETAAGLAHAIKNVAAGWKGPCSCWKRGWNWTGATTWSRAGAWCATTWGGCATWPCACWTWGGQRTLPRARATRTPPCATWPDCCPRARMLQGCR